MSTCSHVVYFTVIVFTAKLIELIKNNDQEIFSVVSEHFDNINFSLIASFSVVTFWLDYKDMN